MHYVQKLKQSFQKLPVLEVINCLQRATYGADSHQLADPYKQFCVDSTRWHSWSKERRENHVSALNMFEPSLCNLFNKPKNCGRKPGEQVRDRKRLTPEVIITDRLENAALEGKYADQKIRLRQKLHRKELKRS